MFEVGIWDKKKFESCLICIRKDARQKTGAFGLTVTISVDWRD